MNRSLKNILISIMIIVYMLIYRFFVYTKFLAFNEFISASFTIILLTISYVFFE